MNRTPRGLELGLHGFLLFILLGSVIPLWRQMSGVPVDVVVGDAVQQAILLVCYVFAMVTVFRYPYAAMRLVLHSWPLWALMLLAFLSVGWSRFPEVTLRRSAALALSTLYALILALRFQPKELIRLLGWVFLVAMVMSLLFVLLLPEWGIMGRPHEGAWRGIYTHKNVLGRACAFAVLVFSTLLLEDSRHKRKQLLWAAGLSLSLITLVASQSATSQLLLLILFVYGLVLGFARLLPGIWPAVWLFSGVGAIVLSEYYPTILQLWGKDVTLTGRTILWQDVLTVAGKSIWLGYGYGGFWLGEAGPSSVIWAMVGWNPPHAHNGYLDILLELGMVGFLLGTYVLLSMLWRARKQGVSFLLIGFFLLFYNMTESVFLRVNNFYSLLLAYSYISLSTRAPTDRDDQTPVAEKVG